VQVAILAREGVHEARLHLNPAEMGPISVQIAVDGTQAQVNFQADVAATRQALESSLGTLADALRDSGLTFSGGSVSDQGGSAARGQAGTQGDGDGSGPRQGGNRGNATTRSTTSTAAPAAWRTPRGVVDLVA
jgi:flagellar hook-length control protein FliK